MEAAGSTKQGLQTHINSYERLGALVETLRARQPIRAVTCYWFLGLPCPCYAAR